MNISNELFKEIFKNLLSLNVGINGAFIRLDDLKIPCNFKQINNNFRLNTTQPIMFPVRAGTTVSKLYIGINGTNVDSFTINLTGDDIVTYETDGTYVINELIVILEEV